MLQPYATSVDLGLCWRRVRRAVGAERHAIAIFGLYPGPCAQAKALAS